MSKGIQKDTEIQVETIEERKKKGQKVIAAERQIQKCKKKKKLKY